MLLGLTDRVLAEVEDRSRQHGVGAALECALREVLQGPDAAAGDDWDADGIGDRPRSIDVSRISPAPSRSLSIAHDTASRPVGLRPPCDHTSQPMLARRASMATTTHCAPNSSASSLTSGLRATAAVFTATLSAPALSILRPSSTERTPPPTVKGMNTSSAVRLTTSTIVSRASDEAVMSRNTTSSAPSWS